MQQWYLKKHNILSRYFFEIAYLGTSYHGWQSQPNAITVQETIEKGLGTILQEEIQITGSGRTDTGVHCRQQYFHADINKNMRPQTLMKKLNQLLPKDIAIKSINRVNEKAHARFDAKKRTYEYIVSTYKDPFLINKALYFGKTLDVPTMNEAASLLLGEHDFESFSKVKTDVHTFNCEVYEASWEEKEGLLIFTISANRFLRGMVRAIVGTLLEVGKLKLDVQGFDEIIKAKDRKLAGAAAHPSGLYLTDVAYPEEILKKQ